VAWFSATWWAAATRRPAPLVAILVVACTTGGVPTTSTSHRPVTTVGVVTTTTTGSSTTSTTTVPPTTTLPPVFSATLSEVDETVLNHSWHEGCPVGPADLRMVTMTYLGFDGRTHQGAMVVHRTHTAAVIQVFGRLYGGGYPIQSMIPIGQLPVGAEDQHGYSNTSSFHCRFVEGTTRWSQHAFGSAIDLNPHLNPLVDGSEIWPLGAESYADRSLGEPGMIVPGDLVVEAFASVGWGWGGNFGSFKDWHHFSSTGT
jgi:D-alanyl-D-alanine carboxypeptidase